MPSRSSRMAKPPPSPAMARPRSLRPGSPPSQVTADRCRTLRCFAGAPSARGARRRGRHALQIRKCTAALAGRRGSAASRQGRSAAARDGGPPGACRRDRRTVGWAVADRCLHLNHCRCPAGDDDNRRGSGCAAGAGRLDGVEPVCEGVLASRFRCSAAGGARPRGPRRWHAASTVTTLYAQV